MKVEGVCGFFRFCFFLKFLVFRRIREYGGGRVGVFVVGKVFCIRGGNEVFWIIDRFFGLG